MGDTEAMREALADAILSLRSEANLASRAGQHDRLHAIADSLNAASRAALAALPAPDPAPEGLSEEERVVMVMALEDYMELCVEQSDDYRHEFRHDEARILGERGATAEALIDRLTPTEAATDG